MTGADTSTRSRYPPKGLGKPTTVVVVRHIHTVSLVWRLLPRFDDLRHTAEKVPWHGTQLAQTIVRFDLLTRVKFRYSHK